MTDVAPETMKEDPPPTAAMTSSSGDITDHTNVTPPADPVMTIDGKNNNTTPSTSASSGLSNVNKSGRHHRRVNSDGIGSGGYPYQQQSHPYPPAQIVYQNNNNNGSSLKNTKKDGQTTPPLPQYSSGHSRDRSWSGSAGGGGVPPFPGMPPPVTGYPMPPSYPCRSTRRNVPSTRENGTVSTAKGSRRGTSRQGPAGNRPS